MTQQINLIDGNAQSGGDPFNGLVVLGVSALAALLVGAHYAYEWQAWQTVLKTPTPEEAAPDPSAAASDPLAQQLELAEAELAGGERLQQAVAALVDAPRDTEARLRSLIDAMPPTMWLRQVDFVGSRGLRIECAALRAEDLARYTAQLSSNPAFAGLPVHVLAFEHKAASRTAAVAPAASDADADGEAVAAGEAQEEDDDGVPDSVAYYRFRLSSLESEAARGDDQ